MSGADASGYYGAYGGRYVPELLMEPLTQLSTAFEEARRDPSFLADFDGRLRDYVGRPTPLTPAGRLSERLGCRVFLKREDLCHTGAHKINNAIGQALLAVRMGKRRVVAETGAGQHGVASATAAALLGLECVVYMGTDDMARQSANVRRMRLLGARVSGVDAGSRTLKDAINEAMRDWATNVKTTHYLLGSALGPHPYPSMVRFFQSVIGAEARAQILAASGELPSVAVACVGGGSNAIGLFSAFLDDPVELIGVEAGGRGARPGDHAARFLEGSARAGVLHGTYTYVLQDDDGNISATRSISAGLDYPAVGPEHAWLRDSGRAQYTSAADEEALAALRELTRTEGILPALESAHAIAWVLREAPRRRGSIVLVGLSGRGDKDLDVIEASLANEEGGRS